MKYRLELDGKKKASENKHKNEQSWTSFAKLNFMEEIPNFWLILIYFHLLNTWNINTLMSSFFVFFIDGMSDGYFTFWLVISTLCHLIWNVWWLFFVLLGVLAEDDGWCDFGFHMGLVGMKAFGCRRLRAKIIHPTLLKKSIFLYLLSKPYFYFSNTSTLNSSLPFKKNPTRSNILKVICR